MRCDLNVSVRPATATTATTAAATAGSAAASSLSLPWGPRAEIKNLNSLKSLQTAAAYEIARQIALNEESDHRDREQEDEEDVDEDEMIDVAEKIFIRIAEEIIQQKTCVRAIFQSNIFDADIDGK